MTDSSFSSDGLEPSVRRYLASPFVAHEQDRANTDGSFHISTTARRRYEAHGAVDVFLIEKNDTFSIARNKILATRSEY